MLQQRETFARELKIDLVEGRVTTMERYYDPLAERWDNRRVNITDMLKAAMDLKNLRVGYYSLVKGTGLVVWCEGSANQRVTRPDTEEKVLFGYRLRAKLLCKPNTLVEILVLAENLQGAFAVLYESFEEGVAEHDELIPVVEIESWQVAEVQNGKIHVPVFRITDRVLRPRDLLDEPPPRPQRGKKQDGAQLSTAQAVLPLRLSERVPPLPPHMAETPPEEVYDENLRRDEDDDIPF